MRRFANGWLLCLMAIVAIAAAPACVQADPLSLKVDMGYNGQTVAAGWEGFSTDQGVMSESHTIGGLTITAAASANGLQPRNRAAVTYADPPGDVLCDSVLADDSSLTLTIAGLAAGTYTMTTYHHEALYGGDGRLMPTVTLNDTLGATVVGADVYITKGFESQFNYRLLPQNGSTVYYQDAPSSLTFGITADGVNPVSLVMAGGSYRGYNTTAALNGFVLTQVPEPCSIVMLSCGLFGLLAYAWRRRK